MYEERIEVEFDFRVKGKMTILLPGDSVDPPPIDPPPEGGCVTHCVALRDLSVTGAFPISYMVEVNNQSYQAMDDGDSYPDALIGLLSSIPGLEASESDIGFQGAYERDIRLRFDSTAVDEIDIEVSYSGGITESLVISHDGTTIRLQGYQGLSPFGTCGSVPTPKNTGDDMFPLDDFLILNEECTSERQAAIAVTNSTAVMQKNPSIGMNITGFYHWKSELNFQNLARHLSWPFTQGNIDFSTFDQDLNWTFTNPVDFVLQLKSGEPLGDYLLDYEGPVGAVEFKNIGQTFTKTQAEELVRVRVNQQVDMRTLRVYHNSWDESRWAPTYLDYQSQFNTIRYMDVMRANSPSVQPPFTVAAGHPTWENRMKPSGWSWFTNSSAGGPDGEQLSIEVIVELSNLTLTNPWINIHHTIMDVGWTYLQEMIRYIDDNLKPGLKCYVELSNEVWNGIFPQQDYFAARYDGAVPGGDANNYRRAVYAHYKATRDMGLVIKGINSDVDRFDIVLGGQSAVSGFVQNAPPVYGTDGMDTFATAPYFGSMNGLSDEDKADLRGIGTGPSQGVDFVFDVLVPRTLASRNQETQNHLDRTIAATGFKFYAYEGGQGMDFNSGDPVERDEIQAVALQAQSDSRMYDAYRMYIDNWNSLTGNGLFCFYYSVREYQNSSGEIEELWAHQRYHNEPLAQAPKMRAITDAIADL